VIIQKHTVEINILVVLISFFCIFFCKLRKYSSSKNHFGAPGSEEKISRSTQTIHTGIDSTCTWCPYLPWWTWKLLFRLFWPPSERPKNTILPFSIRSFFGGLVEEFENWNMMRADKVMRLLCWSWHCDSEWSFGRYAIHQKHGDVACAGTQKQHLSGRWLPPRGWTVRR
jgi:hypothetical protein